MADPSTGTFSHNSDATSSGDPADRQTLTVKTWADVFGDKGEVLDKYTGTEDLDEGSLAELAKKGAEVPASITFEFPPNATPQGDGAATTSRPTQSSTAGQLSHMQTLAKVNSAVSTKLGKALFPHVTLITILPTVSDDFLSPGDEDNDPSIVEFAGNLEGSRLLSRQIPKLKTVTWLLSAKKCTWLSTVADGETGAQLDQRNLGPISRWWEADFERKEPDGDSLEEEEPKAKSIPHLILAVEPPPSPSDTEGDSDCEILWPSESD